jgi:hypothetical protein
MLTLKQDTFDMGDGYSIRLGATGKNGYVRSSSNLVSTNLIQMHMED